MNTENSQIQLEQKQVDDIFRHFDRAYKTTYSKLEELVKGEHYDETQKSNFITAYEKELIRLELAENKLVFGKMLTNDNEFYIGRTGLHDEENEQVLIDWRAKVGELFYRATISDNQGVILRRHINLDVREVISLDDDVLDHNAVDKSTVIVGDGALINALERRRTGEMHDIVSTIQKEQDMIIRTPFTKRLIIQGTPGTGKTVVALHRIAYLLYQYRNHMNENPVLFIGPSTRFITYVSKVLPSLGESGVEHRTIEGLVLNKFELPHLRTASQNENRIKGSKDMKNVLKLALQHFLNTPTNTTRFSLPSANYQITPKTIVALQAKAKASSHIYSLQRTKFIDLLLDFMITDGITSSPLTSSNSSEMQNMLRTQLKSFAPFKKFTNMLWMPLNPTFFIQQILTNQRRLIAAFGKLINAKDVEYLLDLVSNPEVFAISPDNSTFDDKNSANSNTKPKAKYTFSDADLALIDYADYLINGNKARVAKRNDSLIDEAKTVLEHVAWTAQDHITAEQLAERFGDVVLYSDDYLKKYSHICVDEAQELSEMQWEMLKRRSAFESWTIVGDVLQTYSSAGTKDWHKMNDIIGDTELAELSINYRNPSEIAEYADNVAREYGLKTPQNVTCPRSKPDSVKEEVGHKQTADIVKQIVKHALRLESSGLTVIICDDNSVFSALIQNTELNSKSVEVLHSFDSKGLEFDNVIVVKPTQIGDLSPSNLYVALTRATAELVVIK